MSVEKEFLWLTAGELVHQDGWKYTFKSNGEEIKVTYWEGDTAHSTFSLPIYFASLIADKIKTIAETSQRV